MEQRSTTESNEFRGAQIGGGCHFRDLVSFAADRLSCKQAQFWPINAKKFFVTAWKAIAVRKMTN